MSNVTTSRPDQPATLRPDAARTTEEVGVFISAPLARSLAAALVASCRPVGASAMTTTIRPVTTCPTWCQLTAGHHTSTSTALTAIDRASDDA